MIKSPFKAIVICVLLDKKISKTPVFPADMITQGGQCNNDNIDFLISKPISAKTIYCDVVDLGPRKPISFSLTISPSQSSLYVWVRSSAKIGVCKWIDFGV